MCRLLYRSATYDPMPPKPTTPTGGAAAGRRMGRSKKTEAPQPIRKMTEKYSLDPATPPEHQVRSTP